MSNGGNERGGGEEGRFGGGWRRWGGVGDEVSVR
jgi:hypothetical protein